MFSHDQDSMTDPEEAWNRGTKEVRERHNDISRADFEARVVSNVLNVLDMSPTRDYLVAMARELTGDPTVSFALFHHFVPDFPIRLGVAKLYDLDQTLTLETLFRRPGKSPVYRAFHEWADEDQTDDDRHRGIIFRLPGCPGNGSRAVLHTYPVPVEGTETRITFGVAERRGLVIYTLEPLDQLLGTLLRTYRPGHDYA